MGGSKEICCSKNILGKKNCFQKKLESEKRGPNRIWGKKKNLPPKMLYPKKIDKIEIFSQKKFLSKKKT